MSDDEEPTGSCVVCHRRDPYRPMVCDGDRAWLPRRLADLVDLERRLAEVYVATQTDTRRRKGQPGWRDPVAAHLPAGPVPGENPSPQVSGTRDKPVPANLGAMDLAGAVVRDGGRTVDVTGDSWIPALHTTPYETWVSNGAKGLRHVVYLDRRPRLDGNGRKVMVPAGDQTGVVPVAAVLDSWVRDWIECRDQREHRPATDVPTLAGWLTNRLDWACDAHPAVGEFAAEVGDLIGACRAVLGETDPRPERCDGVACPNPDCDKRDLWREPPFVECHSCAKLMTEDEYRRWAGLSANSRETHDANPDTYHAARQVARCPWCGPMQEAG